MVEELMRVIVPCVNEFYNIRILVFCFQLGFSIKVKMKNLLKNIIVKYQEW